MSEDQAGAAPHLLAAWRERHGLSQKRLAQMAGTAASTICRIERGNARLCLSALMKAALSESQKVQAVEDLGRDRGRHAMRRKM
jgi:transcriptional regulator with XRE-family HTH domain